MHPDETAAPPPAPSAADASPAPPPAEASAPAAADDGAPAAAAPEPGLSPAECGARLAELFPALFVAPGAPGPFKPIKLRIHADILARAPGVFSKRVLGIFFSRYTTSGAYLKALTAPDAQRFDLDGQPAGEIAEVHRAAALEELARRHAIAAERRTAQRKAMAPPAAMSAPAASSEAASQPAFERERVPRRGPDRDHPRAPRRDDRQQHASARPRPDNRARPGRDRPERAPHRDAAARPQPHPATPATPALPVDPAARERALLLRAFESSPLSKANFCVLKRISETELDSLLAQARAERA